MSRISVWGFRWAPDFAQGLVRDLRVRWALIEAGRSYEVQLIGFEERTAAPYRQRQPFGMVPAFEADGLQLFESGAIVHHIASDCAALMPADASARAEVLTWMFAALNTVEPPIQNLLETDLLYGNEPWAAMRRPVVVDAVKARLGVLAGHLQGRDHLLGSFTAADILMTTTLRLARHAELVAGFPVLDAYVKRCEARPAFRAALAEQMADYARNTPIAA
ncbi:glutathione S-transferase family protein [Solimonas terrae]|uniref:Glutathione S-transferase family protein n=1 Tax=Solimonas terrae TaxID=1396819 RepID=A0A6M2BUV4_9GAMM|nr:glutathione S-transferase family protein [Solimonas terrae]NGY06015.1 glutathione S-transferase family protein [Solimonas terrae]